MKPLKDILLESCGGDEAKAEHLQMAMLLCGRLANTFHGVMLDASRADIPEQAFITGLAVAVAMVTAHQPMRDILLRILETLPATGDNSDATVIANTMAEACLAVNEEAYRRAAGAAIDRDKLQ